MKFHYRLHKEPASGPYTEPDESSTHPYTVFSNVDSNIKINFLRAVAPYTLVDTYQRFYLEVVITPRSQWPPGLRGEISPSAQTLGSMFESHSRHGCLSAFILCLCCSGFAKV
jgi:hypothetical protein